MAVGSGRSAANRLPASPNGAGRRALPRNRAERRRKLQAARPAQQVADGASRPTGPGGEKTRKDTRGRERAIRRRALVRNPAGSGGWALQMPRARLRVYERARPSWPGSRAPVPRRPAPTSPPLLLLPAPGKIIVLLRSLLRSGAPRSCAPGPAPAPAESGAGRILICFNSQVCGHVVLMWAAAASSAAHRALPTKLRSCGSLLLVGWPCAARQPPHSQRAAGSSGLFGPSAPQG